MTGDEFSGYPHHLAGEVAPPPEDPSRRVLDMALKAHGRARAAAPPTATVAPWRPARSIETLFAEANAAAVHRSKVSDGIKGDARHEAEGSASDHNPWVIYKGHGIVRAGDLTNDPVLQLAAAFERLRAAAHAGKLPQVLNGGYAILNDRITAEDWSSWHEYHGDDPHVSHGHVSVSVNPAQFDLSIAWGIFHPAAATPPARPTPPRGPAPAPVPTVDLRGAGSSLRGDEGNVGPRVRYLQEWLNRYAPAYSHLKVDGIWGPATSAVIAEFGHRSGVPSADGRNIGPALAAVLWRAGLFRPLSAARQRALGHIARGARR